ncbi:MAG: rhomboid family intramembrane serine protease [Chitinispirillaceae bacterium]|nr:rhomboid family intramembrane serine protease [Chitinispirillaceae bacterium]
MIPVKIDEARRRPPAVTVALILFCTVIFFKQPHSFIRSGLVPLDFIYTLLHPEKGIVQSITVLLIAFFLHGNLMHLFGNMWYLWLFGSALENLVGVFRFFLMYLLFGIISMLVQVATDPLSTIPIVGASGAIAGIMGMYLILRPFSKIIFWFPPLFTFRLFSFIFLLFWFWLQWNSIGTTQKQGSLIAWWAHIGGFICGMLCALWLRLSNKFQRTTSHPAKNSR